MLTTPIRKDDLTPQERHALELRYDGPIPPQAVASVIANRKPVTVADRIKELREYAEMWRGVADREAAKLAELMAKRDETELDAERDRLTREIAQAREDRDWCLNKATARDAEADALEAPQAIAAE